jgi:hypothetical protein
MGLDTGRAGAKRYPTIMVVRSRSDGEIKARRVGQLRAAPLLLAAVRSPELGRVRATVVPGSPELARNEGDDSANSLVGLWPQDRGQRGENDGEKALCGSEQFR